MMAALLHGVAKRGNEHFTVWTGAEMASKLGADVFGQLVVDIGGQLSKNVETSALTRLVRFFPRHEPVSLGRQSCCD